MSLRLLGGLTPREFLRRHWQKCPLFVRQAFPGFKNVLNEHALAQLATRDDVESRIVQRRGARYETTHGPFERVVMRRRDWTLLVSGVNLHHRGADALLRCFSFVPQARLDDLMVSYATTGGGVGPHVDSYDVFLLQGSGRRRWKVWDLKQKAFQLMAGPGDLLYLPPGWRHDGVALEPCFTHSIGFRVPRGAELGAAFLDWLHEHGLPDARYTDPLLKATRAGGRIPGEMKAFAARVLRRIRWGAGNVTDFLGEYLSMPKPHIVFRPGRGRRSLESALVRLDPKTQLLYSGKRFFINGERFTVAAGSAATLRRLADRRSAQGRALAQARLGPLISAWQRQGYVHLEAMYG